ncbi:MAG: DUF2779 domain-containing protein, partial [Gammaproteobacteria bacterium]|nr:DUF2779 domain-containing protein [Gammaproteobacteria bacterium]
MTRRYPYLSKSMLIAAWQCRKRLYLEHHHPELGEVSPQTESLWKTGREVGQLARHLYATEASVKIDFNQRTHLMLAQTKSLVASDIDFPIFEATFQHDGILVRSDVLIPAAGCWRAIEVKASTSVKDHHVLDCAIQDWVMRQVGLDVASVSLAHVDNRFVYPGQGDYAGL